MGSGAIFPHPLGRSPPASVFCMAAAAMHCHAPKATSAELPVPSLDQLSCSQLCTPPVCELPAFHHKEHETMGDFVLHSAPAITFAGLVQFASFFFSFPVDLAL